LANKEFFEYDKCMKNIFIMTLVLIGFVSTSKAQRKTLADQIDPQTYSVHASPVLNIALVDYGQEHSSEQLTEIKTLLEERFYLATDKMLKLNVSLVKSLPYKYQLKN
jgi:hypothetical protein